MGFNLAQFVVGIVIFIGGILIISYREKVLRSSIEANRRIWGKRVSSGLQKRAGSGSIFAVGVVALLIGVVGAVTAFFPGVMR